MTSFNDMCTENYPMSQMSVIYGSVNPEALIEKLKSSDVRKILRDELMEKLSKSDENNVLNFIKREIPRNQNICNTGSEYIYIKFKNNGNTVGETREIKNGEVIVVGRSRYCDISTFETSDSFVSRFQLIINRKGNEITIADYCSQNSTYILENNKMNEMRVSIFNPTKKIENKFCFGDGKEIEIYSKHKECIICFEKNRNIILRPCGHFVMCGECFNKLSTPNKKCPTCNSKIENIDIANYIHNTFVCD